ncbi:dipeptide epimerase [Lacihabitans sp. LS3-19]|uniref:mandelate racemase/muconate lactonizing enzyme family protein n=1 Tax=Lacihabitans sp. LS3-19 TaxID=2487335 RepID=UPI0020CE5697|nr:dipeptide epimerase [Lacihabitans sp. LS3-19]MCP9768098.1 dipeptide epimerase [Lacihabitans sp. LS3-19]
MKIKHIRPYLKHLPLTKPYTIAYNTFTDVELVFLEIELEDGTIGLGSASPAEEVVGENSKQTLGNLQSEFVQNLIGRDIRHFQQIIFEAQNHFPNLPGTLAAIDIALHDAFGKFLGISISDFYGQKIKSLPTSVTIGIMNVEETLKEAENFKQLGFRILKVKTGHNVEEDIERVRKIHEKYGNGLKVRVDANQGYDVNDLLKFVRNTEKLGLELIEQPIPVGKEKDLMKIDTDIRQILCGDESMKNPKYALKFAAEPKPFGIYNIKLMKCGGLKGAFEIATIAQNAAIDLFWGCNDESIVSITAALHTAYCCPNTKYIDLDGSFDLAEDLVSGGFTIEDGYLKINKQAGFGYQKLG